VDPLAEALERLFDQLAARERRTPPGFAAALLDGVAELRLLARGLPEGPLARAVAAAQVRVLRELAARFAVPAAALPELAAVEDRLPAAPPAPPAATARPSVVVAEDSRTRRELHRGLLAARGFDVRTAADGEEALALLAARGADAVVCDLRLPPVDGPALARSIRARPDLAGVGVVVVAEAGGDDARCRSLRAGADAFLGGDAAYPGRLVASVERVLARTPG
jgi:CheY-like chemotaxis protein